MDNAYQISLYSTLYNYPKTTAYTNWLWYATDDWDADSYHNTPDMASALQEVISRPGWEKNNSIIWFSRIVQDKYSYRSLQSSSGPNPTRPVIKISWV